VLIIDDDPSLVSPNFEICESRYDESLWNCDSAGMMTKLFSPSWRDEITDADVPDTSGPEGPEDWVLSDDQLASLAKAIINALFLSLLIY